jgi:3,4-dihydroxy 2-butanone 4-phosphate synthase/GTP cyclohydrolase II
MDRSSIATKYAIDAAEIARHVELAKRSRASVTQEFVVAEAGVSYSLKVEREGVGPLKTVYGRFQHFSFKVSDTWEKYSALVRAPIDDSFQPTFDYSRPIRLRIDSGCETGQLLGDLTCECRGQLDLALDQIAQSGQGVLINIPRQDGRGMGLPFKLATLYLQAALGVDTVEAGSLLEPDGSRDIRTYSGVVAILMSLGVSTEATLELSSNNPSKVKIFADNGYSRLSMVPCAVAPTEHTRQHLIAKQRELGHIGLVADAGEGGV